MSDDAQLLRQFAEEGTEPAFRELVERHLPLVNATARRIVAGDAHLAQDVTQVVFTDLARKAATLPENVVLGGWLYRHTCYTAMKAVRAEHRRRARERTAMEIHALNDSPPGDAQWLQLAPVLDEALNQLDADDRDAIVLRYLQQRDVRSIGLALGASENAAQKRLGRALEKLRAILTRRGVTVSAALLATTLDAGAAISPVSTSLAASISANALAGASTAVSTSLMLSPLKTMITSKLAIGVVAFAAGIAATVLVIPQAAPALRDNAPLNPPKAEKPAATPVVQLAANQVEAPKVAPVPAHNTTNGEPMANPSAPSPFGNLQPGTVFVNPPQSAMLNSVNTIDAQGAMVTTTVVSGGNPADPFATNPGAVVVSTSTGGPTQVTDNGDGTMTITLPDGSTRTIPKPGAMMNTTDDGTGTMTMTLPDGSTRIIKAGTAATGGGVVVFKANP